MKEQQKKNYVKFASKGEDSFYDTVKLRVDDYFRTNSIDEHANTEMRVKTVTMLSLYFLPFIVMITGITAGHPLLFLGLWFIMGIGIVGIGTGIMHDSNHGSYSEDKKVNTFLGNVLNLVGGYALNWRIQHNILHHTYTNLDGLDEDIEAGHIIRMSPRKPYKKMYKYQHIYAWFLYCLMNLFWVFAKDFRQVYRYDEVGLLRNQKTTLKKTLRELVLIKSFYLLYVLGLPIAFSGMSVGMVIAGFCIMHLVAGLSLALIFQPAHVMEMSDYAVPNDQSKMENSWAVHQLLNTVDFCPKSKITSWFMGGLNYQIEHHLFPQICHMHYPKIAPIVQQTAEEYGLAYNVIPTFAGAIYEHGRMLHILSKETIPGWELPKAKVAEPAVAEMA